MKEDKGKVRVIVFELEGNNQSIQESLRTVSNALSRNNVVIRPALPNEKHSNGANAKSKQKSSEPQLLQEEPAAELEVEAPAEQESEEEPTQPAKPKRARQLKIVDLNLKTGVNGSLESFASKKAPTSTIDRFLVIACWLKENGTEPVGPDHFYTCYKHLTWSDYPKDFAAPLGNGKRDGYFESAGAGVFRVNHIGEGRVAKMGA